LIKLEEVKKSFVTGILRKKQIEVVKGVSFEIQAGETLGLVGESGCGKTTLAKVILRLIPQSSGKIFFEGKDTASLKTEELKKLRAKMQLIFQHPEASLNPRMKVYDCIVEPLRIHRLCKQGSEEEKAIVSNLLEVVGLQSEHLSRYPNEISGGQAQRVVLARILSLQPKFLIADEPTSMLDVSVQAQILNLLKELQKKFNMAILFVSHDLEVVRCMSDRIAVMYKGDIIELGRAQKVFENPLHPYTKSLVESITYSLSFIKKGSKTYNQAHICESGQAIQGCSYCINCSKVNKECSNKPQLREIEEGHYAACWQV
jgi:oligopeptide/dipeptide ABC transporter ATP-binding protein